MKKLSGKTILVVDDEPDLREIMTEEFECAGANVLTAENGTVAFEMIKTQNPDAVVSDVRMPGGDGFELLANAKKLASERPVILLITGFSDYSIQQAYDAGAAGIFSKPCDFDALIDSVSKALQDRGTRYLRKFERLPTDFSVKLTIENINDTIKGNAVNLGLGGMYIALAPPLPEVESRVSFTLEMNTPQGVKNLEGVGICRWARKFDDAHLPSGIGVEFSSITQDTFNVIEEFIQSHKPTSHIPISR